MIKIAITGNISSGKSTVSKIFETFGFPVFNSDLASREAEKDPEILSKFLDIVGHDILVDAEINRTLMRERIFNDSTMLQKVNELMTPYVSKQFQKFVKEHKDKKAVIMESAIIFEGYHQNKFDMVITVVADKDTRIKRTMTRDGLSLDLVLAKIKNQLSDDFKARCSDFIIINEDMPNCDFMMLLLKQVEPIIDIIEDSSKFNRNTQ
jgi:dephospho-CoA kinase